MSERTSYPSHSRLSWLPALKILWWSATVALALTKPFILAAIASPQSSSARSDPATMLIREALSAQGGETRLRGLRALSWRANGFHYVLDRSAIASGPFPTEFDEVEQVHDLAGHRYFSRNTIMQPGPSSTTITILAGHAIAHVAGDSRQTPGTRKQQQLIEEFWALNPERILLSALDAGDVHTAPDDALDHIPQHVVVFTLDGSLVRLYLDPASRLPTAWEYTGPLAQSGAAALLGDAILRMRYTGWCLTPSGIRFPLQWNVEVDGQPDHMLLLHDLQLDSLLHESELTISADVREAFDRQSQMPAPGTTLSDSAQAPFREIFPGILWTGGLPGTPGALLIRQNDGVVVVDAPLSSEYSKKIVIEARKLFPDAPIKAFVSTSGRWASVAGVREYVADGIPVYGLAVNRSLLERILATPHTQTPDLQARQPRKPLFHWLKGSESISFGKGDNSLQLYLVRGISTMDRMMIYLPVRHLLYAPAEAAARPSGHDGRDLELSSEIDDAVTREHLSVDQLLLDDGVIRSWKGTRVALTVKELRYFELKTLATCFQAIECLMRSSQNSFFLPQTSARHPIATSSSTFLIPPTEKMIK